MSDTKPSYELHTPVPHVTRFVCRTCGLGVENTIDGNCERCYANTRGTITTVNVLGKPLAYPQPTNYLQEVMDATVAVRVDEPSLERIRALVEEAVRRVLREDEQYIMLAARKVVVDVQADAMRTATIDVMHDGVRYRGTVYEVVP